MTAFREYEKWAFTATGGDDAPVFPDGCRDVLVIETRAGPPRIVLTDHDLVPRQVQLIAGTHITGYRLRPGSQLDPGALDAIARQPGDAETILTASLRDPDDLGDAILALTRPGASLGSVAAAAGVSERTLQRRFREFDLPAPDYWRLLARARRAAQSFASACTLADIAGENGYADQAHITRECLRWFGATPARLRGDPRRLGLISQPALGNWTAEQISTR
ncbi:AraC family transcriptional regulator [Maricaulis sp.]|uniref:AraC family transcriptional regulator n=1 Tax=Maricaulis sp. TaxID=1486257 RepID=UPI001B087F67|nr:AraC family transcriptional regulator [Maricaulis sp.]MBO6765738.1 helix-turn-helix transcriptional regulator [Maricaulis sp.]